jgi:hypothetical protein
LIRDQRDGSGRSDCRGARRDARPGRARNHPHHRQLDRKLDCRRTRSTIDIDIVAALGESDVPALLSLLSADFYANEDALLRAARERSSTNLIHQATQLKIDILVAGGTPLDEQQLHRRQAAEIAPGRTLYVHPPEDILLQKLRWYRKGGDTSERQWRDILGIIRVQAQRLDRGYLRVNAPVLGVADLLVRAFREAADEARG